MTKYFYLIIAVGFLFNNNSYSQNQKDKVTVPVQWTQEMFESLFPQPLQGWLISKVQVQELKTFAQLSGLEGMSNMVAGISGKLSQAPSVRYQLTRTYRDSRDSTHTLEVRIDSEDINTAGLVLAAHGYSRIKNGKPIPFDKDKKYLQDKVLNEGVQLLGHDNFLGIYAMEGSLVIIWLLVGETGVIVYAGDYTNCFDDLNVLVKRTDVQRLDVFSLFNHRKKNKNK